MELKLGEVYDGTVSSVMKFGAFVSLGNGKSGLVHISEIADTFIKDINSFVSVGQPVRVKVIGIADGKINLSMKQAGTKPQDKAPSAPVREEPVSESGDPSFEDKLKKFMQDSDSRIAGNPMYADRGKQRRRR